MKYDPDDLNEVRVYDDKERLLCTATLLETGGYDLGTDSEAVKVVNSMRKKERRAIVDYMAKQQGILEAPNSSAALAMIAQDNLEADASGQPTASVLEPINWNEQLAPTASGDTAIINFDLMCANARRKREE